MIFPDFPTRKDDLITAYSIGRSVDYKINRQHKVLAKHTRNPVVKKTKTGFIHR